jgi:Coenzyme PQQ synthesis protein D (PqqD)
MTELRLQKQQLEWREVDGEVIALERKQSAYLAANQSGTVLWRALADGTSDVEMVRLLMSQYDIDADTARADVDAFVSNLDQMGLLERQ